MEGCRAIQCLLLKRPDWNPESDDQDFELDGRVFLTGIGDGSPDLSPLESISPVRHVSATLVLIVPTRVPQSKIFCFAIQADLGPFHNRVLMKLGLVTQTIV